MRFLKLLLVVVLCFPLIVCKKKTSPPAGDTAGGIPAHTVSQGVGGAYNVLLITVDTLRQDRVGCYSEEYVKTPHIDNLAKKSFLFKRAFAHNPVTLPSHTNILTGTTALYHGISDNTGFRLDDRFLTVAEYLKEKNYDTGAFVGAFPLDSRFGLNQGFDVYDDNYGTHSQLELFFVERSAQKVVEPAMEWISTRKNKWFSWIHLFDPHQPYNPPEPFDGEYPADPYSGEVAYVDSQLGVLFDFLEKNRLMENTVVVFTGDHGEALGEKGEKTHSYFAYNNTILIPLILYVPGAGAKAVDQNVSHVDIFPTLCDLLGFKAPEHLQGESLLPVTRGEAKRFKEIYFESMTPFLNRGWAPLRGFVRDNLKFIDQPIKEVYDLSRDMDETRNLVGTSNIRTLLSDLERLTARLTGQKKMARSDKVDPEVQKRLESLGYLSSKRTAASKTSFTKKDDLKTLLPLQNKMLEALAKLEEGDAEGAVAGLTQVVAQSPNFILAYNRLANIYKDTGRVDAAVDILKKGLNANPGNLTILSRLGIILAESGRHKEAVDILKECVEKESFNPENFNYLGVAHYKAGNFDAALENYQKALELDDNYASVFNNIGTLYLTKYLKGKDRGDYTQALAGFDRAIELDPRIHTAYNGRGAAYLYGNRPKKAIEDWLKAIEIKPDFIDPYFSIGITYLRMGDKPSASRSFMLLKDRLYNRLPPAAQERLLRLIQEAKY